MGAIPLDRVERDLDAGTIERGLNFSEQYRQILRNDQEDESSPKTEWSNYLRYAEYAFMDI